MNWEEGRWKEEDLRWRMRGTKEKEWDVMLGWTISTIHQLIVLTQNITFWYISTSFNWFLFCICCLFVTTDNRSRDNSIFYASLVRVVGKAYKWNKEVQLPMLAPIESHEENKFPIGKISPSFMIYWFFAWFGVTFWTKYYSDVTWECMRFESK